MLILHSYVNLYQRVNRDSIPSPWSQHRSKSASSSTNAPAAVQATDLAAVIQPKSHGIYGF